MAQSALTVTPPNPTPPTNFGAGYANTGPTTKPPNVAYAATVYNDPWHPGVTNVTHPAANNPSGVAVSTVPPWLDDGVTQDATHFSINEKFPTAVTGLAFAAPNSGAASEGAGSEVAVTQTYSAAILIPGSAATYQPTGQTPAWADGAPGGPLRTVSDLGNYTTNPNRDHASSLSPAGATTLTSIAAAVSGGGTTTCTATGTNFTPQSVLNVNGISYPTTFTSSTTISCTAPKKATAGTLPVYVITGGAVVTATVNWTFS